MFEQLIYQVYGYLSSDKITKALNLNYFCYFFCFQDHHEEGAHRVSVAQADCRGPSHPRVHHPLCRQHEAKVLFFSQ